MRGDDGTTASMVLQKLADFPRREEIKRTCTTYCERRQDGGSNNALPPNSSIDKNGRSTLASDRRGGVEGAVKRTCPATHQPQHRAAELKMSEGRGT